jgi:hypothetical protein
VFDDQKTHSAIYRTFALPSNERPRLPRHGHVDYPNDTMLTDDLETLTSTQKPNRINSWIWTLSLGALFALLAFSRLIPLNLSLWHDEVVTIMRFVEKGPTGILYGSYIANNHILFNLLTWALVKAIGPAEWAFRVWSAVPAILALPLLLAAAWQRQDRIVVMSTAVLFVTSPLVMRLSIQGRGYGLCFFAMSGVLAFGIRVLRFGSLRDLTLYLACGVIGVLTLPVFVLPFGFSGAVLFLACRGIRKQLVVGFTVAAVVCAIVFLPILGDMLTASQKSFGRQLTTTDIFTKPFVELVAPSVRLLLPGARPYAAVQSQPPWVQVVAPLVSICLAVLGVIRVWRRSPKEALFIVVPVFCSTAMLFAFQLFVADRFVSFLVVPLLVLVAEAPAAVADSVHHRRLLSPCIRAALVAVALIFVYSFVVQSQKLFFLPRENFKDMATYARAFSSLPVISNSVREAGIQYYLDREVEFVRSPDELIHRLCTETEPLIFIHHPTRAPKLNLGCLERSGASKSRFKGRTRASWIDVWILNQ